MKKLVYTIITLACFSSCGRLREQTNINFDANYRATIRVPDPALITGLYVDCPVVSVATRHQALLDQHEAKADKVQKVHMLVCRMDSNPDYQNFDYIDSIHVYASTSDLPELMIARKSIIPKKQFHMDLVQISDVQLKDYFLQDTIYIRAELFTNKKPQPGTSFDLAPVMYVEAKSVL